MQSTRSEEHINKLIREFLDRKLIAAKGDSSWIIKHSELGGFGVFASRDIEIGELIFKDFPVILGPRASPLCPLVCVGCYKSNHLRVCDRKCGLPVCSVQCQNSVQHNKECNIVRQWQKDVAVGEQISNKLLKSLTPIRGLFVCDKDKEVVQLLKAHDGHQHGHEVDDLKALGLEIMEDDEHFMRSVCCILDANAFEVAVGGTKHQTSVRGLYPLGSLMNHCCVPNIAHVFDVQNCMVARATVFIPKGAELFHSYCRLIWGTSTRRYHLKKTKHFLCKCNRCQDPTEFRSYMNAINCKNCKGKVIAIDPLKLNTNWRCEDCMEIYSTKNIVTITSLLGSVLHSFENNDIGLMLKFLNGKMNDLIPDNNQVAVELKMKIIWILGHIDGFTWEELSENLLFTKEQYCQDILMLLELLGAGQCKLKGLLIYEIYCCINERNRRNMIQNNNNNNNNLQVLNKQLDNLLSEAADILLYDVNAPQAVKEKWKINIKNDC